MFFGKKKKKISYEEYLTMKKKSELELRDTYRELKSYQSLEHRLRDKMHHEFYAYKSLDEYENELKEEEDYIVTSSSGNTYNIFINKEKEPFLFKRNDREWYFMVKTICKGKIINKIRQQRTHGSLDGKSSYSFSSSGGRYPSFSGGGRGYINGSLDTNDEFILTMQYKGKFMELRVNDNLFYSVSEGDELWMDEVGSSWFGASNELYERNGKVFREAVFNAREVERLYIEGMKIQGELEAKLKEHQTKFNEVPDLNSPWSY